MKTLLAFASTLFTVATVMGASVININTPQEFIQFSKDVNSGKDRDATVYLQDDLDFTGLSGQFQSVGIAGFNDFVGVFDGQGHTISHLAINDTKNWRFGVFSQSSGATIRNTIVDSTCSITKYCGSGMSSYEPLYMAVGGIIGSCSAYLSDCLIESNIFMGKVTLAGAFGEYIYLAGGGILGEVGSYEYLATVKNCANYGTVSFTGTADAVSIGGVVGMNYMEMGMSTLATKLTNCLNYGFVSHSGTVLRFQRAAGIIAYVAAGYIDIDNVVNCGYIAVVPSAKVTQVGCIAGLVKNANITDSYWAAGSGLDVVGSIPDASKISQCSNFSTQTFALMKKVAVGSYSGNSLLAALNAGADAHAQMRYSKWLLNKDNHAVSFAVNGETPFFKTSAQIVMMTDLADGVSKRFEGWYTDSACTTKVTSFEIAADTNLYGKFA